MSKFLRIDLLVVILVLAFAGKCIWDILEKNHKVLGIKFFRQDGNGLAESNKVPLIVNVGYGWIMKIRPGFTGSWREEFTLPEAPRVWNNSQKFALKENGKISITSGTYDSTTEAAKSHGFCVVDHFWSVAPGDPKGTYITKVFVDDVLVATFNTDFY